MFDAERIRERIERAALMEMELSPDIARNVAFHMTDCLDNLQHYVKLCQAPESLSPGELNGLLLRFLIHVPNHVAAAAKLYADMPVSDICEIGAALACPHQVARF